VTLSRWFLHKTAFFTEQCTSPSLFSRFEVTQGNSNRSLKYGFLYGAIFSSRVRIRKNHLATKCITQDCWIRNTVGQLGMFEANDSSANTA